MSFPTPKIANSDITVASAQRPTQKKWCHIPTLSLEISDILNIFYFTNFQLPLGNFI